MKRLAKIFVVAFGLCFVTQAISQSKTAVNAINADIDKLEQLFSDGIATSYPEFRDIKFGPVFGKGRRDAIALFNLEGFHGGNANRSYLAFFEAVDKDQIGERKSRPIRLIAVRHVGGKEWRDFDFKTAVISRNSVQISGKAWSDQDAGCCPSTPITVIFTVSKGQIVESKQP
jgi:hypothetical protein